MRVNSQFFDDLSLRRTLLMMAIGGKAYAWRLSQGWRRAYVPAARGSEAGER